MKNLVIVGILLMLAAVAILILIPTLSYTQVFGIVLLFIVGMGCAVAGTETKGNVH